MRFFSARLNFDNGIVLKFDGFLVNLFQYKSKRIRDAALYTIIHPFTFAA